MRNRLVILITAWALGFLAMSTLSSADLMYRGWGIRAGVGDDPDQGIVGAHWDLGTLTKNLRWVPNLEGGFGDNHTIISTTLPLHYVFPVDGSVVPFAGGGPLLAYVDHDHARGGSDFEVALGLALGAEWTLKSGNRLFLELDLTSGDTHDVKFLIGWTWMRR